MKGSFTVFFEDPFWVGIFEEEDKSGYRCCRVVFGEEPSGPELFQFIRKEYNYLKFSQDEEKVHEKKKRINPKRLARETSKHMTESPYMNKAYDVIRKNYELMKDEKKQEKREKKEMASERRFKKKNEKRKQKHRGH